jgi:hypothetical protein
MVAEFFQNLNVHKLDLEKQVTLPNFKVKSKGIDKTTKFIV